jgi:excisionase family DNA binding protein
MSPDTRATDPTLKPRDCADRLGVSSGFIIGEIRDGRLRALVIERKGFRTIYRIREEDLQAYLRAHRWHLPERTEPTERADAVKRTDVTDATDESRD